MLVIQQEAMHTPVTIRSGSHAKRDSCHSTVQRESLEAMTKLPCTSELLPSASLLGAGGREQGAGRSWGRVVPVFIQACQRCILAAWLCLAGDVTTKAVADTESGLLFTSTS